MMLCRGAVAQQNVSTCSIIFGEYETDTAEETPDELKKLINGYDIKDLAISWGWK
jgi:hypothetical protein